MRQLETTTRRVDFGHHLVQHLLEYLDVIVLEGADGTVHVGSEDPKALPEIDTSLQQRLGILTPDMDRAISALQDDDVGVFEEVLDKVVAEVDSPGRRLELAQAVLALRDQGRIPSDLAAAAGLELDGKQSTLFLSSVAESLAVLAGDRRTPAGILVATR